LAEKGHRVQAVRKFNKPLEIEFANAISIALYPSKLTRSRIDAIQPCENIGF
jgi:hypothetical protein